MRHRSRRTRAIFRHIKVFSVTIASCCLLLAMLGHAEVPPYDVPERTDLELLGATREACEAARAQSQPLLLEFTAAWCSDCRALDKLKQEPKLAQALARYRQLAINVGRFDRHPTLLQSFGVRAIAYWVIVAPRDCSTPPYVWPRIASRTLEPATGTPVRSDELASWLDTQRGLATRDDGS